MLEMQPDLKDLIKVLQDQEEGNDNGQRTSVKNAQSETSRHNTEINCGADASRDCYRLGNIPIPHKRT